MARADPRNLRARSSQNPAVRTAGALSSRLKPETPPSHARRQMKAPSQLSRPASQKHQDFTHRRAQPFSGTSAGLRFSLEHALPDYYYSSNLKVSYVQQYHSERTTMAEVTATAVKQLREKTGAGMMECKNAPVEAQGNQEAAIDILRKRGLASAKKREGRIAAEGIVGSYIHMGGKVGVLVEVNCETDFVARGEEFQQLVKDIAMHVAAAEPRFVSRAEVPANVLEKEREIAKAQARNDPKNANKPDQVIDKIVEGRLNKFYEETVLMDQPFVKDPAKTVAELVVDKVAKTGEKITIRRFTRYKMGEGLEKRDEDFGGEVASLVS